MTDNSNTAEKKELDNVAYRIRNYTDTLAILDQYRQLVGITRLADITHLDYTGIPVFTAIRPRAKSLSTSQGKGLCINAAKCSALMEAIEVYFAENIFAEIEHQSIYDLNQNKIPVIDPNHLNKAVQYTDAKEKRNWVRTSAIISGASVLAPFAEFSLNSYLDEVLIYSPNTTGLAGGNTYQEALLHSVLEIIERDPSEDELVIGGVENSLLNTLSQFFEYKILYKKNRYRIPSFEVLLKAKNPLDNQVVFTGNGCHLNKNIALNRAITEAIQSRVTIIAGSRDDILNCKYDTLSSDSLNWMSNSNLGDSCHFTDIEDIEDVADHPAAMIRRGMEFICKKIKQLDQDILVFKYYEDDICIVKSKIISSRWINTDLIHADLINDGINSSSNCGSRGPDNV